jgi:hypothetical protein
MRTHFIVISLAVGLFAGSAPAQAEDVNGAAKAFSQAQEAMLGGDVARAADLYELADELAPSAPSLRNATRARLAAGHLALAATHAAALLRRYPSDKESREVAEAILSRLSPQLAQLDVVCTAVCTLLIDGKVIASVPREQHQLFTQPGAKTITVAFDADRRATSQITATANHITSVRFEVPSPQVVLKAVPTDKPAHASTGRANLGRTDTKSSSGLSRWWAIGGGAVTVTLAAATVWSGLTTLSTRDDIRNAVVMGNTAAANSAYSTGHDQQTRTNILIGVTATACLGTAAVALFTNWSSTSQEKDIAIVPNHDGLSFVYGGHF